MFFFFFFFISSFDIGSVKWSHHKTPKRTQIYVKIVHIYHYHHMHINKVVTDVCVCVFFNVFGSSDRERLMRVEEGRF